MIEAPKGYVALREVAVEVSRFVAGAVSALEHRRDELENVTVGQIMLWQDFAVRSYIAHTVQLLEIPVFVTHPKLPPVSVDTGPPLRPLPGANIWTIQLPSGEEKPSIPDALRDGRWIAALIDTMIGTEPPPSAPDWTGDATTDGRTMLFKKADADRLKMTVGGAQRSRPGRPFLQDQTLFKYDEIYPEGHKAEGVPLKTAAAVCGVSEKTLRRALKRRIGTK